MSNKTLGLPDDVHVHWLRSRLEEDPASPQLLHTVRGVGYVFRRPAATA